MVNRDGHIDVVFRNGLKNLEVLPPGDVWDSISPALTVRREPRFFLRVAAGIAALVSLGILAFFAGSRSTSSLSGLEDSYNQELIPEITDMRSVAVASLTGRTNDISSLATIDSDKSDVPVINYISTSMVDLPEAFTSKFSNESISEKRSNAIIRNEVDIPESIITSFSGTIGYDDLEQIFFDEDIVGKRSRWKVGARISPTYLSSNLKAANQNMSELLSNENALLSYTGGLAVSYSMGKRLSLQTGIYYSSLGREISGIESYSGFAIIAGSKSGRVFGIETTSGTVNTTNKDIFLSDVLGHRIQSIYTADNFDPVKADLTPFGNSLRQNFEYLEVPVVLSYKVIDRKIDFNLLGGVSYNFLLDNKTYALGEESMVLVGSTEDINKLLLSSALGMSLEYSFSDRFSVNIEPSLRYYLNNNGRLSIENSYTFGVYSGLFLKF